MPKGAKRPSAEASLTDTASKKRSVSNGIKEVIAALERADLPRSVIEALTGAAPHCLPAYADDRHEFQAGIIDMIGSSLEGIETSHSKAIQDANAMLAKFDLAHLEAAIPVAARELAAKKGKQAELEAEVLVTKFVARKSEHSLKQALNDESEATREVADIQMHKDNLSDLIKDVVAPLRSREPSKKEVNAIEAKLKAFGVDSALLAGMEAAFCKGLNERSDFDKTIMDTLDTKLNEQLEEFSAKLADAAPGVEARAAAAAEAKATSEKAAAEVAAAQRAYEDAKSATEAAQSALEKAQHLVKDFVGSKRSAERDLEIKTNALAAFQQGPLKSFQDLKARSTPVTEPEPIAKDLVAAEPNTTKD